MRIWDWVFAAEESLAEGDAEERRLAAIVSELPSAVCADQHERVDLLADEGIALARARKLVWLEVFLRHWHLQSRILNRREGAALGDAVALVDFAHSADAEGCPQAVCTVQDLGVAYGIVDGPGYAEARRAVAEETLARITPSWPCFRCIAAEAVAAFVDEGDPEGALAFVARADARAGGGLAAQLWAEQVDALLLLGAPAEACAVAARAKEPSADRLAVGRAVAAAAAGRVDEARATLPPLSVIAPTPSHYLWWAKAMVALVAAGAAPNDAPLDGTLTTFAETLLRGGSLRAAFDLRATALELAVARGDRGAAEAHLAPLRALVPSLKVPLAVVRPGYRPPSGRPGTPAEIAERLAALLSAR